MRKFIKRACLISGGGSWGAFGGGTLAKLNKDYDTIVGVSTGSLLAPLAALKEWDTLKLGYTTVTNDDVFDYCWYKGKPITRDGKIRKFPIVMTLLLGHESVCTSNTLRRTIDRFFSKEHFNELNNQHKNILVGTQNFAQVPSKTHYFSSMDEKYEDFKDWMWCSACFPFFTSLVKKSWRDIQGNFHIGQWTDGGLSDLIGIDELIGKGYGEIDIILHRTRIEDKFEGDRVNNLLENVTTSINTMRYDIEFEFFHERIKKLNKQGAKVTVYWLPRRLKTNSMVFNRNKMISWWDEGYETALNLDRIDVFEPTKRKF